MALWGLVVSTVERLAAITGPWFDEGYEAGRLDPAELACRIAADPSLVCDHPDVAAVTPDRERLIAAALEWRDGWLKRPSILAHNPDDIILFDAVDDYRAALAPARREATDGR